MIEIQNWRDVPVTDSKAVAVLFDVYLPKIGLTLRNLQVVRKKKGGFFISPPKLRQKDRESGDIWIPYFSFNEERDKEFYSQIYELIKDNVRI
jgi:hypothetical protein